MLSTLRIAAVATATVALLAGCDTFAGPPSAVSTRTGSPTVAASRATTQPPPRTPPRTPTSTAAPTFAEQVAVPCAGYPSGEQVVAFLRRTSGMLPSNRTVTVRTGPLCAGTWQYTELAVPEQDPLLVVTQGPPAALVLVTAGTDVCSVAVRATAPAGIRAVTNC